MGPSVPCLLPDLDFSASIDPHMTLQVLQAIEDLGTQATGALLFGTSGLALVERGAVCWATAHSMRNRLTDLLRYRTDPPLEKDVLDDVYASCRRDGVPLGERLVARGLVSSGGLRSSLRQHNAEAIMHISREPWVTEWRPHSRNRYDASFSFATGELLASIGALRYPSDALVAKTTLQSVLPKDCLGMAQVEDDRARMALPVALTGADTLAVHELLELSEWGRTTLDICSTFAAGSIVASGIHDSGQSGFSWRHGRVTYIALCPDRGTYVRALGQLEALRSAINRKSA